MTQAASLETAALGTLPELVGGRYRLGAELGRGSWGIVYRAWDEVAGSACALKLLRASSGVVEHLRQEFAILSRLRHPSVVSVLDFGVCGEAGAYLSADFLSGRTLAQDLEGTPTDARRRLALDVARAILEALEHVHACGVVHADVKPSNLLKANDGYKLADFGLAGAPGGARGSLAYMAPEVIEGQAPDVRSDLYSLGLTLLHVLMGLPLFRRAEDRLQARHPAALALSSPDVAGASEGMRRLLRGLLADEPTCRFRSAGEALQELLGGAGMDRADRIPTRWDLPLVGRQEELEALAPGLLRPGSADAARSDKREPPAVVVVSGPEGMGKSRLLIEIRRRLQVAGVTVAVASGARGGILAQWRACLKAQAGSDHLWDCDVTLLLDEAEVLSQEDLDGLALATSGAILGRARVIVAGRREKALRDLRERLDGEPRAMELRLGPLPRLEICEAVNRALGRAEGASDLGDLLADWSQGVPRRLLDGLQALEEASLVERQAGRFIVTPVKADRAAVLACLRAVASSASMGSATLSVEAVRAMASLALVAPGPLPLDVLDAILPPHGPTGSDATLRTLGRLEAADLVVRVPATSGGPGFALRDGAGSERWLDTGTALGASVVRELASRIVDLLGDRAEATLRDELLGRAGREAEREALRLDLAECLRGRGELVRAAEVLERHAEAAGDPGASRQAAALYRQAGQTPRGRKIVDDLARQERRASSDGSVHAETLLELAEFEEAEGRLEEALALLLDVRGGVMEASSQSRLLAARLWLCALLQRFSEAEEAARAARALCAEDPDLMASVQFRIGLLAQMKGDHGSALEAFSRARDAAVTLDRARGVAAAENGIGSSLRSLGRVREAVEHLRRSASILEGLGDVVAVARAEANLGNALYELGDWRGAEGRWRRSTILMRRSGDPGSLAANLVNLADLLKDQGRWEEADRLLRLALRLSAKTPRVKGHALLAAGEIALRRGRLKDARERLHRAHRTLGEARELLPVLALRSAELALAEGKARLARRLTARALRLLGTEGRPQDVAMALRLQAVLHRVEGRPGEALELLVEGRAGLDAESHQLVAARLDAEMALCHRDLGDLVRAQALRDGALATFCKLGAEPDRERLQAAIVTAPEAQAPAGEMEALLDVTRAVSSELSLDRLLALIVDHAIRLSGAERGFLVLQTRSEAPFRSRVGRDGKGRSIPEREFDVSLSTIREVVASGRTVARAELGPGTDAGTDSVLRLGLRSLACAPIRTRESDILGAIYVDSSHSGAAFGPRVVALLEALAAQAGVAIVNAGLYEEQRRKNELIAVVSHELRGPLTSIKCYVDLIRMDSPQIDEARRRRFMDLMDAECIRLCRLVENILDLARLESGRESWSVAQVDLAGILQHAVESCRTQAELKGVELGLVTPADLPSVLGNGDRILQVVLNLLGNALKFTPEGGHVRISAAARSVMPGRPDSVEVRITDDGPGIEPAEAELIFEKFGRVGRRERTRSEGTGLGLPIAREIVEAHGGRLWVESRPGQGSTFAFRLPAADPS